MSLAKWYARQCDGCGKTGPVAPDSNAAFRWAKKDGWQRVTLPPSEDAWPWERPRREDRCPTCVKIAEEATA